MDPLDMTPNIYVDSGEVVVSRAPAVLRTSPLGSCVAVSAYDLQTSVGGIAHVMLPGWCLKEDTDRKARYAEDAVGELLCKLKALGADLARICVCLVGGADVLGDGHEGPGSETVQSLAEIVGREGLEICAKDVGGRKRRGCTLDLASGRVTCTVGNSAQRVLWDTDLESNA